MEFDAAFEKLIGHEGGFVDHPSDPGGATKFGVSQRSYPGENIRELTLERAKEIYRRDFWGPAGCDALPDFIRFDVFDMAVNSGVKQAAMTLQRAVFAHPDGVIGPKTLMGVQVCGRDLLIRRFNGLRLEFMAGLSNWPAFSRGWAKRIASNLVGE